MRVGRGAKVKVDEETVDAVFESKSYERAIVRVVIRNPCRRGYELCMSRTEKNVIEAMQ